MSAEPLPAALSALLGQHPAAIRTVCWDEAPGAANALRHLEIETKHGQVVLIDHSDGRVYARPPIPPGPSPTAARWQRDLTETLPGAFDGRPTFTAIAPVRIDHARLGWRFELSTGSCFTLIPGDPAPELSSGTTDE